ncbi:MAG: tRNA pseudouridine(13) synthase TruD, partial [Planctomycetota bacterium JB042]
RAALPPGFGVEARALTALRRARGDAGRALGLVDRRIAELHLNALQASLFNEVLAERIDSYDRLIDGDVAWLHRNGAVFDVPDAAAEAARAAAFEISPSGPLIGPKCRAASGPAGEIEEAVARRHDLPETSRFRARSVRGGRRPLRVPLEEVDVSAVDGGIALRFRLPPGSYATSVLREVTKSPAFNGPSGRHVGGAERPPG